MKARLTTRNWKILRESGLARMILMVRLVAAMAEVKESTSSCRAETSDELVDTALPWWSSPMLGEDEAVKRVEM